MINEKYRKLKRIVVVSTPDLLKIAENATWVPNLVPLNDALFLPRFETSLDQERIKICQSPTRKFHKHTREFKTALRNLRSAYRHIQEIIIEKTPYRDCLKIKRACHIVFDHLRGWFGIASLESLSHGKPVVAGLDDWNIEQINSFTGAENLPWVIARNQDDLQTRLANLVEDRDLRRETGLSSRKFMESYWTEQHVLTVLMAIYDSLQIVFLNRVTMKWNSEASIRSGQGRALSAGEMHSDLPPWPKRLTIEFSAYCNLSCRMCPRNHISAESIDV